ncbi:MAG: helix-turn-helix domain-containing protein [Cyanobacteria bacterium P01_F01_bin.150]
MKPGSKYHPLFKHLQHCKDAEITLSFAEIEALIGDTLPASARVRRNWWSNRDSTSALQAKAWIHAEYHVKTTNLEEQQVTFQQFQANYTVHKQDGEIAWTGQTIKALRRHKGLKQEDFAKELGVRRETVSEWENSKYEPDRSKRKLLKFIAKEADFTN